MKNKQKIEALQTGQSLTVPFKDKDELQRIRNYCHKATGEFQTRVKGQEVTITKLADESKDTLANRLRAWPDGHAEIVDKKIGNVSGVIASLGMQDNFEVRTVTRVEKIK